MKTLTLAFGLALLASGCRYDGTDTKMQWAPDMADSAANKSQRSYIDPPEGSVAMNAIFYPKTAEDSEKLVSMPQGITPDLERGKWLFETYCQICHGPDAKGGKAIPQIAPPNLTDPMYLAKGDGFFFYRITFGTAVMPGYGHAISADERWHIVKYLRTLQGAAK